MSVQLVILCLFSAVSETLPILRRCRRASGPKMHWMRRNPFVVGDLMAVTHGDSGFEAVSGSEPLQVGYRSMRHMVVRT